MQDHFRVNQEVGDSFIYFRLQKSGSEIHEFKKDLEILGNKVG